jgi:hypothetical protein
MLNFRQWKSKISLSASIYVCTPFALMDVKDIEKGLKGERRMNSFVSHQIYKVVLIAVCFMGFVGSTAHSDIVASDMSPLEESQNVSPGLEEGSVMALNRDLTIGSAFYPAGTEMIIGENGELFTLSANGEDVDDIGVNISSLDIANFTVIGENDGELKPFNIPGDFDVAGRSGHRRHRSGVTNCYHVGKAILARKIKLTGVAAYMAAPQLERAHWIRYASYAAAPNGSACVFGAGGKATRSGGQRYGHFGVKGRGGIVNPESGFKLHRPFLGCWAPPRSVSI